MYKRQRCVLDRKYSPQQPDEIIPFPLFTITEILVPISAFVACWSTEFHSNERLPIRFNRDRHTCRSSEKLDTYTYIGDP